MSSLREVQHAFGVALLGGNATAAVEGIASDGLTPDARLAIYRHHVSATLTDALKAAYPVVCRLVDERFFAYAADRFIAAHPPTSPCLSEYGDALADFLADFEPCRHLPYLPDVARLEWAMIRALNADDAPSLDHRALRDVSVADLPNLRLRFHPSLTLVASPWPIDRIWRMNQRDANPADVLDLAGGAARVAVRRHDDEVVLSALDPGAYALRRMLDGGHTLGEAAVAALAADASRDLVAMLRDLFADGSLVDFSLTISNEEDPS